MTLARPLGKLKPQINGRDHDAQDSNKGHSTEPLPSRVSHHPITTFLTYRYHFLAISFSRLELELSSPVWGNKACMASPTRCPESAVVQFDVMSLAHKQANRCSDPCRYMVPGYTLWIEKLLNAPIYIHPSPYIPDYLSVDKKSSTLHRTVCRMMSLKFLALFILSLAVRTGASSARDTNGTLRTEELLLPQNRIADSYRDGSLRGSLILYNGRIHTMDKGNTIAKVLAIDDGEIVYIGDSQDDALRQGRFQSRTPRSIDLGGRMAVPGLIDCHNHIVLLGNRPGYHTPLERAWSIADAQATYQHRATGVPEGAFITTIGGFGPNQFSERRLPTLAELDAAAPDHPVFLSTGFNGPSTTNTLGKAFFESLPGDARVSISANGAIPAGLENGKALLSLRQRLTFADRKRSVRDAMAYAASVGITTHLDQGAFPATNTPSDGAANEDLWAFHQPFLAVYADGAGTVRLRINFLHMDNETAVPGVSQRLQNTFKFFGNAMVRTGAIGEFATADYAGGPVFEAAARRIARAGWRLEVHSLTGADYQTQIAAFEAVDAAVVGGIRGLRWVVAHVPLISGEYLGRLKRLGGGVNLSGWNFLAGTGNATSPAGPPFRRIVESGIPAGFGADGANIAPLSPWPHVYYAVTGRNARGEVINPGQLATRQEVLEWYTRANTWFLGGPDETQLGVLEVGRLGDVVVLSDDYFAATDEQLKDMTSVLTVVGGVVVHDAGKVQ
ncbi:amidohydrolase family-domain-containing protein [Lasiosphaeria hispida]|uniref:Amidohydrolase family-domain-containing protein n=1 Tax=Lasiosphaeria hispida TaxID=260671 RepID=A0AAJ0MGY5_9PEZI|nr:amidohydrolase family-domain-containing protein [Lasiosphaeria hispida]